MNMRSLLLIWCLTGTSLQPVFMQACCRLPFSFDTFKTNLSAFFSNTKVRIGITAVGLVAGAMYAYRAYIYNQPKQHAIASNNELPEHITTIVQEVVNRLQSIDRERRLKNTIFRSTNDNSHALPRCGKIMINTNDYAYIRINAPLFGESQIVQDTAYFNLLRVLYHESYHAMISHCEDENAKISSLRLPLHGTYAQTQQRDRIEREIRRTQEMAAELGARYCLRAYHNYNEPFQYAEDEEHPTVADHKRYIRCMLSWFSHNQSPSANVVQFLTQTYWNEQEKIRYNPYCATTMPTYDDYRTWNQQHQGTEVNDSFLIQSH